MSNRIARYCFCTECEQLVGESVKMVRWFEMDFCDVKCLNKYMHKNAVCCNHCKTALTTKKVHVIKSASKSLASSNSKVNNGADMISMSNVSPFETLYFCSTDCVNQHKAILKHCDYCSTIVSAKSSGGNQQMIRYCSEECYLLHEMNCGKNAKCQKKCSQCGEQKNIIKRLIVGGVKHNICSIECCIEFEAQQNVDFG